MPCIKTKTGRGGVKILIRSAIPKKKRIRALISCLQILFMINQRPCCLVVIWTAAIEAYHELKLTKGLAKLLIKSCCATDMDFQGLRPSIPSHSHPKLVGLLKRCWQRDPFLRPEFSEILELLQQLERTVWEDSKISPFLVAVHI